MKETEVEIEEKEVERVYCDECGDECTDDHEIKASEVCQSCADSHPTYESLKEAVRDAAEFDQDDGPDWIMGILITIAFLPFIFPMMLLAQGVSLKDKALIMSFVTGGISWTIFVVSVFLL